MAATKKAQPQQKSMQEAILETKRKIVQAVNESGLPIEVIGLIFEVFTNSIQNEISKSQTNPVAESDTVGE